MRVHGQTPTPERAVNHITSSRTSSGHRFGRAKKSLGQHFLTDRGILKRIIEASDLSQSDTVLEIGPGRGLLTHELAAHAGRVIALELDEPLIATLKEDFKDAPHVDIIHADARTVDTTKLLCAGTSFKIVANLPYYAASPIIRRFLNLPHKPSLMVVMVQHEVAREMAAQPGDMGFLSVLVQLHASVKIVCKVPPRAFKPKPKVDSAVLRLDVLPKPSIDLDSEENFIELVRAGFSAPRKQVHNCLQRGLDLSSEVVGDILTEANVEPKRRAETLSMDEWGAVYTAFRAIGSGA
ncbi:MAG: 16S rRNA (adenine(1518)-N(6)/adenine(1519)-N(6))-dimethyltransferase RsmA [Chloroflexi bacterium]|nr:16S rRNA (adenine(1518)-N(6)/adenine(1519)-N(6))-dimethyltransferase RsmA [Chloroflexota bacterium]